MKIVFNNAQKMNEIIFANRNKNYGAYAIRSAYNSTLLKSLSIVASTVLFFGVSVYVLTQSDIEKAPLYLGSNDSVSVTEFNNKFDESNKSKDVSKPKVISVAVKLNVLSTTISDTVKVEHNTNTLNNNMNPNGNPNGDPNANSLTGNGTATASVNTPSVAVIEPPTAFPAENPEFDGGDAALRNFIAKNIVYPQSARDAGQEGKVYITFVIDEQGHIESSKVLKGIGYGCDEESIRVINKLPKFKKPGRNTQGKPVKVIFNIPILFKMQ